MPEQLRSFGAGHRRVFSKILLLCALGAALLLAACAGTSNAGSAAGSVNSFAGGGATPDAQGFVLASVITPAPTANVGGSSGNNQAPALFGGLITAMVDNGAESVWKVGDHTVHVTSATNINAAAGGPQIGAHVTVGGVLRSDGSADAAWVRVDDAGSGNGAVATGAVATGQAPVAAAATPAATSSAAASSAATAQAPASANGEDESAQAPDVSCGFVEQLPQSGIVGDWRVNGRTVHVGSQTRVQAQDNGFELGSFAFVRGALQADGSMNAQQIWVRPGTNNRCLPGLRVGQNNGAGQGNGVGRGKGNGNGDNQDNGNGNGKGPKDNNGKGPKGGKGNGKDH